MAGAPKGNNNAAKAKIWTAAINRALERKVDRQSKIQIIDALADKLVGLGLEGDLSALKELGDRLEGKPHQSVAADIGGDGLTIQVLKLGSNSASE